MELTCVELKGYVRFSLSSIDYFCMRPKKKLQQIIGTNGSGKSSLLKELSPLPGNKLDFRVGGSKYVEINNNGSFYQLRSSFEAKPTYSFIKDGEELNPGLTVTVYKELVEKEFGTTEEHHKLRTGVTGFHSMSVAERRKFFTELNEEDYTYALRVYQSLKDKVQSLTGALKFAQARLVQESAKIVDKKTEEDYTKQARELRDLYFILMDLKTPTNRSENELRAKLAELDSKIKYHIKSFFDNAKKVFFPVAITDTDALQSEVISVKADIIGYERRVKELSDIFLTMENNKAKVAESAKHNKEAIKAHIAASLRDTEELYRRLVYPSIKFPDPSLAYQVLTGILGDITPIVMSIPANKGKAINSAYYQEIIDKLLTAESKLTGLKNLISLNEGNIKQLESLKNSDATECPKCSHTWIQGYDEVKLNQCLATLAEQNKALATLTEYVGGLKAKKAEADVLFEAYMTYRKFTSQYSQLKPLWDYITTTEALVEYPEKVLRIIESVINDINTVLTIDRIFVDVKVKEELLTKLSDNQDIDTANLDSDMEKVQLELIEVQKRLHDLNLRRIQITNRIDDIEDMRELSEFIDKLYATRVAMSDELTSNYINVGINTFVQRLGTEISKLEDLIFNATLQAERVAGISKDIADIQEQLELCKIAVKELSPNEGLIAKGMIGPINHFLAHVNAYIKKVWLYPLEILPIEFSEEEQDLDYKFKLRVGEKHVVSDVSLGSSAMKEMVDMAVVIVTALYKGHHNHPLYIDEFARGFDDAHRHAAVRIIEDLINNSNFSQIFMISHYNHMYGSLTDADVNVLCSNNLSLPKDCVYNTNVTIQ